MAGVLELVIRGSIWECSHFNVWGQLCGMGGCGCGGFQVAIQRNKVFISVWRRETVSLLEDNKRRVLVSKKRRKTLAGHDLCEYLLKEDIFGEFFGWREGFSFGG